MSKVTSEPGLGGNDQLFNVDSKVDPSTATSKEDKDLPTQHSSGPSSDPLLNPQESQYIEENEDPGLHFNYEEVASKILQSDPSKLNRNQPPFSQFMMIESDEIQLHLTSDVCSKKIFNEIKKKYQDNSCS